jgi:4-amino-4-deoxy-L-arabinose transferase-like glycosyltransferase
MTSDKKLDLWALLACLGLALAFRLPGLTVFLTADEARSWFGRSIIFLDSLLRGHWANTAPGGQVPFIENVSLSPAPGVTTMWMGAIGIIVEYLRQDAPGSLSQFVRNIPFDPLDPAMLSSLRLPGVLIAVAAVGLTYWWSRPLFGRGGALLTAGLIALDPFSLALSRVLGHDGLVSTFMWLSLLAFIRAITNQRMSESANGEWRMANSHSSFFPHPSSFILYSGAFAGLACLSKYPALFIGVFIALTMLFVYGWQELAVEPSSKIQNPAGGTPPEARQRAKSKIQNILLRWMIDMLWWSVAAAIVFGLLWPAMWVDPLGLVMTILNDALRASGSSHPKGSFFLGQPVPDPGWLFYPLVALFRTTPVILLGLLLSIWQLASIRKIAGRASTPGSSGVGAASAQPPLGTQYLTLIILLAYVLFYTLLVTYGGKKQDRYLLPIFPALAMLSAIGYTCASMYSLPLGSITHHASVRSLPLGRITYHVSRFAWLWPLVILFIQAIIVLPSYPYYFTFYNPLAGGGETAARLIQIGWGEGLDEAAAYLNTLPKAESLKVVSWYSTTFEPYFKGQSIYEIDEEKISRSPKPGLAGDYVIFYINQTQRQLPSEGALQFFRAASPVYTVTLSGIDYAWIYPSVRMQHVLGGEVRLVGQSELLGYNLTNEAGQPVTAAYPESVVFLSLYWEWQGQAEEDKLRISLVDGDNQTRGWGNPIETAAPVPRAEWQDGMVARDDFALVIFPDTPPGEYRLAAWIERPATSETVGVFPLEEDAVISIVPRENKN